MQKEKENDTYYPAFTLCLSAFSPCCANIRTDLGMGLNGILFQILCRTRTEKTGVSDVGQFQKKQKNRRETIVFVVLMTSG